jgi:hypothetical protein
VGHSGGRIKIRREGIGFYSSGDRRDYMHVAGLAVGL